jgi:hypothetical protein
MKKFYLSMIVSADIDIKKISQSKIQEMKKMSPRRGSDFKYYILSTKISLLCGLVLVLQH